MAPQKRWKRLVSGSSTKAGKRSRRQDQSAVPTELRPKCQAPATAKYKAGVQTLSSKTEEAAKVIAEPSANSLLAIGQVGGEKRVSFVARVTIDERGEPRRTEVEYVQSGKKEIFPTFDVERLTAFVKACIGTQSQSEPVRTLPSPAPKRTLTHELTKRAVSLTILDVKAFSARYPGVATLTLDSDLNFLIQARLQLQGPDALSLTADEFSCEIKVFANEITRGTSRLLTTHTASLVKDTLEYTIQTKAPGLSSGLYRLTTLVTLHTPANMIADCKELIIQFTETQTPI